MKKKRNVWVDEHLAVGGVITGFLTFMGFLPGAGAAAAITGAAIASDIKREKREAAAIQEQKDLQVRIKKFDEMWSDIESDVNWLESYKYPFDRTVYKMQLRAEELFAKTNTTYIRLPYYKHQGPIAENIIFEHKEMVDMPTLYEFAEKAKDEDKYVNRPVENKPRGKMPELYAVMVDNVLYWSPCLNYRADGCRWYMKFDVPPGLMKRLEVLGIEVRGYYFDEFKKMKRELKCKLFDPYRASWDKGGSL